MDEIKTEEEFKALALKHYDNPLCFSKAEFEDDARRFQCVANLLDKYRKTDLVNERLILNHLIILHNLFGRFTTMGLFYKVNASAWIFLATYLTFLGLTPNGQSVGIDPVLMSKLESI